MPGKPPRAAAGTQPSSQTSHQSPAYTPEENNQNNDEVRNKTPLEEYNDNLRFIDEILIEGQKININKITQIKEKLLEWLLNQTKTEGKVELLQKENEKLRKQLEDKPKQLSYAQTVQKPVPATNPKIKQIEENKDNGILQIINIK